MRTATLITTMFLLAAGGMVSTAWAGQDAALIEKGQQIYTAQKCTLCHSIAGKGNAKGPLDDVGSRLSADDIRKWIVSPQEMKSETNRKPPMRAYKLSEADLEALVAYMVSLKGS